MLESEIIIELVKCYLEKRKMVLDGQLSSFNSVINAEEIASTRSKDSSRNGSQAVHIDITKLATILAKDLANRKICDELEMAKLKRALNRR